MQQRVITIKWDHEKLKLEGCVICQSSMISYGYSLTVMKTRDEVVDAMIYNDDGLAKNVTSHR